MKPLFLCTGRKRHRQVPVNPEGSSRTVTNIKFFIERYSSGRLHYKVEVNSDESGKWDVAAYVDGIFVGSCFNDYIYKGCIIENTTNYSAYGRDVPIYAGVVLNRDVMTGQGGKYLKVEDVLKKNENTITLNEAFS